MNNKPRVTTSYRPHINYKYIIGVSICPKNYGDAHKNFLQFCCLSLHFAMHIAYIRWVVSYASMQSLTYYIRSYSYVPPLPTIPKTISRQKRLISSLPFTTHMAALKGKRCTEKKIVLPKVSSFLKQILSQLPVFIHFLVNQV